MARLFQRNKPCGPLCQDVQREVAAQQLAQNFERLATRDLPASDDCQTHRRD